MPKPHCHLPVRMCVVLALMVVLGGISFAQNIPVRPKPKRATDGFVGESSRVPSPGNWSQLSKFISGDGVRAEYFGESVSVSGDTVVVGAQPSLSNSKVAYVFRKTDRGWRNTLPVAALMLPTPTNAYFTPLAIDGDTVVVGNAAYEDVYPGSAYVYVKPPGGWKDMTPTAILTPSDTVDGDFGQSVSISGNTIVIGDPEANSFTGTAYVYVKPRGGWANMTQTAKLSASDGVPGDYLGNSVSCSGATVALGAPQFTSGSGKAYVYVEPKGGWSGIAQTAELTVPGVQGSARIGLSISVNEDVVLAGAPNINGFGAAYIFEKPSTGWRDTTQTATLTPGDVQQYDFFGNSVGLNGKLAVIGAPWRTILAMWVEGGIYVFEKPSGGWRDSSSRTVLTGSDARYYSAFGDSVAIDGNVVVGGADFYAVSAFVFGLP